MKDYTHTPKKCRGCYYRRLFYGGYTACHYMIDTGKPRGCPPEQCIRYKKGRYKPSKELY